MTQTEILNSLLNLKKNEKRVFVFDLDSTLFNVTPRNQEIVRHFAKSTNLDDEVKDKLLNFNLTSKDWGIKPGLLRIFNDTPEEHLINSIKKHWNEYFFSGDFLHFDQTYPGALDFVNKLNQLSPVYYLTGRDIKRMGLSTHSQLKKTGFPIADHRNQLILKSDQNHLDHLYKLEEILNLKSKFNEIHFFENEPLILNSVYEHLPEIKLYYIDSVNSGRAKIHPEILTLKPEYL